MPILSDIIPTDPDLLAAADCIRVALEGCGSLPEDTEFVIFVLKPEPRRLIVSKRTAGGLGEAVGRLVLEPGPAFPQVQAWIARGGFRPQFPRGPLPPVTTVGPMQNSGAR